MLIPFLRPLIEYFTQPFKAVQEKIGGFGTTRSNQLLDITSVLHNERAGKRKFIHSYMGHAKYIYSIYEIYIYSIYILVYIYKVYMI